MDSPNILFLRPTIMLPKIALEYFTAMPPLGIGYLAAVLEREGYTISILDAFASGWDRKAVTEDSEILRVGLPDVEIIRIIRDFNPNIVGITNSFTSQAEEMMRIATLVKRLNPDINTVVGGVHPSAMPLQCMMNKDIDFLIKGEGEKPILELLRVFQGKHYFHELKGVYYRRGGEIIFNGENAPIQNLDEIPFPAYHLMPMDKYFDASQKDMTARGGFHDRWVHIITSRGCPYSCNFCSVPLMEGHKWRYRSPKNIVDEIEFFYNKYQIKRITIEDSNFALDINRAEAICDEIIRRDLKIKWTLPNGVRADKLSRSLLDKMRRAGAMEITLGIEHGDQQFLDRIIRKRLDLKKVEENVKSIRKARISASGFFIIGIPSETRATVHKTIKMAGKLARLGMIPFVNIAMPLPGTEMYNECIKNGYIPQNINKKDYLLMGHSNPLITTKHLNPKDLIALRRKVYLISIINILLTHPFLLLKVPVVKATLIDMLNPRKYVLRLRKLVKVLFP